MKRIKVSVPCAHSDSLPDRDPATLQQDFVAAFGRSRTEALAGKLKFPLKHLFEIDGSKRSSRSNAYFFGLPWVRTSHIL